MQKPIVGVAQVNLKDRIPWSSTYKKIKAQKIAEHVDHTQGQLVLGGAWRPQRSRVRVMTMRLSTAPGTVVKKTGEENEVKKEVAKKAAQELAKKAADEGKVVDLADDPEDAVRPPHVHVCEAEDRCGV